MTHKYISEMKNDDYDRGWMDGRDSLETRFEDLEYENARLRKSMAGARKMRFTSILVGAVWYTAAYFGLGVFVETPVGYYIVGIISTFGFLLLEQRI